MTLFQEAPLQSATDSLRAADTSTAYDSLWGGGIPEYQPTGFEEFMLSEDKLFVVLAVVLLIWIGIALFLLRTDRKIAHLERSVDARIPDDEDAL